MVDFNLIKELSIVEGNVVKIENEIGQVIWQKNVKYDRPIKLGVEKITANTYAGETTYENEEFMLLDIYPETTDSIISVTYEGLTKTLTFNGTNAKQVYFGTFNGVSDSVLTPSSGIVTIEGQCVGFSCSSYNVSNKSTKFCSCITEVYDFGNINRIPTNAFRGCTNLALTELPISITAIGGYAFYGCTNLALTELPSGITSIPDYAFYNCEGIAITELPSNLTSIGKYAFNGCTNLAITSLPNGITSIGDSVFKGCTNLALVGLPVAVNKIGNYAFGDCTSLKLSSLPNEITEIGDSAFSGCKFLELAELPYNLNSIGDNAFKDCSNIKISQLPINLKNIGSEAFYNCLNITNVIIPDSVTSIGEYAYYGCARLKNIIIGNGLAVLPKEVFGYFGSAISSGESVYARVGKNIQSIESGALDAPYKGDGHIIEMTSTTPPTIIVSDANNSSFGDYWEKIIVPKGYGNVYKTADEWNLLESQTHPTYIVEASE